MTKLAVGVLGATGMAGQRYLELLQDHPWFEVTYLAASSRSSGQSYAEAVAGRWHLEGEIPAAVRQLVVRDVADIAQARRSCELVFSAVDSKTAAEFEMRYAGAGLGVVSNASAHRQDPDVPVIIPEVNPEHLEVLALQRRNHSLRKGFVVAKPNCSLQSYLTPLHALREKFGVLRVLVTTMQALSGAGHPGISGLDALDNVIPYIAGEEEKSEQEPLKILGQVTRSGIVPDRELRISAHCNRVPTRDGHLACVSVEFDQKPSEAAILRAWSEFEGVPQELKLPSAPPSALVIREEPDRPQVLKDRMAGRGMAVTVGRLRACNVLHHRFVGLSHNTIRGAAGGGILIAELLRAREVL